MKWQQPRKYYDQNRSKESSARSIERERPSRYKNSTSDLGADCSGWHNCWWLVLGPKSTTNQNRKHIGKRTSPNLSWWESTNPHSEWHRGSRRTYPQFSGRVAVGDILCVVAKIWYDFNRWGGDGGGIAKNESHSHPTETLYCG